MIRRNFITGMLLFSISRIWSKTNIVFSHIDEFWFNKCKITNSDNRGKFYRPNAPQNNLFETKGKYVFTLRGTVFSEDCITKISGAIIEIWQANEEGSYDMNSDLFKNRTTIKTDSRGYYEIVTFMPGYYSSRPRHIHYIVKASNYKELTTQIYFKNDSRAIKLANSFKGKYEDRLLEIRGNRNRYVDFNIYLRRSD